MSRLLHQRTYEHARPSQQVQKIFTRGMQMIVRQPLAELERSRWRDGRYLSERVSASQFAYGFAIWRSGCT